MTGDLPRRLSVSQTGATTGATSMLRAFRAVAHRSTVRDELRRNHRDAGRTVSDVAEPSPRAVGTVDGFRARLTRKRSSTSSRLQTAECLGIGAILGRLCRPFSRQRLACLEEGQRNRPSRAVRLWRCNDMAGCSDDPGTTGDPGEGPASYHFSHLPHSRRKPWL